MPDYRGCLPWCGQRARTAQAKGFTMSELDSPCAQPPFRIAGLRNELWSGRQLVMASQPRSPGPSGRFDAAVAISPDCLSVLVMGGVRGHIFGGLLTNDVWHFEVESAEWECLTDAPWEPRRGHAALIFEGSLLVIGGIGARDDTVHEVWAADVSPHNWRPQRWRRLCSGAPWGEVAFVTEGPKSKDECAPLLIFTVDQELWSSNDGGVNWQLVSAVLPFGDNQRPMALAASGYGSLWVVTTLWDAFESPDCGKTWVQRASPSDLGACLRQQFVGLSCGTDGPLTLLSRSRDVRKVTMWSLNQRAVSSSAMPEKDPMPLDWEGPLDSAIFPCFASLSHLVASAQSPCSQRTIVVEHNTVTEFTVWRAGLAAVAQHRKMLRRLGTAQQFIDPAIWMSHVCRMLLPDEDPIWEKKQLKQPAMFEPNLSYWDWYR